uniref:Uncharacterized protein n=1 Tax=Salix viminalis TaxID=40686 RepID=A0A6N2MSA7_SALVM
MEKFPPKGSVKDFKDRIWLSTLHHEDSRVVSGPMIAWSLWYARKGARKTGINKLIEERALSFSYQPSNGPAIFVTF